MDKEIVGKIIEYLEKTSTFVSEQAPDIIQQTLKYEKINCIMWLIISFILVPVLVLTGSYCLKHPSKDGYGLKEWWKIMSFVFLIIPIGISIEAIMTLMKIYIAPKLFLLTYFKNLF